MTSKTPARVAEDVDENVLSYAEIKSLATGNPLIKEKMDLDVQVSKLKMLEKNFKSNLFELEDNLKTVYPQQIKDLELTISNIKKDIQELEPLGIEENKFTSLKLNNNVYTDKKEAGENLLLSISCHRDTSKEQIIGSYRGFKLSTEYSFFENKFSFKLSNNHTYNGYFGKDSIGNITRMDNALERMSEILKNFENKLIDVKNNVETAAEQIKTPFPKADELREKQMRLIEVNRLLSTIGDTNSNEVNEINLSENNVIDKYDIIDDMSL